MQNGPIETPDTSGCMAGYRGVRTFDFAWTLAKAARLSAFIA
jgi:hypothetical protein